ncbi:MAG: AraC family transcriptional regulator [Treponema sp.]|nr:AraC family transcriptional regulator [Treponema sp.]
MTGKLGNIITLIGHHFAVHSYFEQRLFEYSMGNHNHSTIELFYVVNGRANYTITSSKQKTVTEHLKKGDLILLDANCPHRLSIEKGCHGLFLELNSIATDSDSVPVIDSYELVCNCDSLLKAFHEKSYILLSDFQFIKQTILRLQSLLNSDKLEYADHYFTQVIIAELLLNINECYRKTYLTNPYISRIIEFIIREYQENITASTIAKAVNMNETYMQKLFKKEMGETLLEYITKYRISQSIALMRNTNMKFVDIAAQVGFNNRQTFYNAFKEFTGYNPLRYKKFLSRPVSSFTAK